jgi:ubiquinol-cytochrome c reductase iron-sulfur subunit
MIAMRTVVFALLLAIVASVAFVALYVFHAAIRFEGVAFAVALAALAVATIGYLRAFVAPETVVDDIDAYPSSRSQRAAEVRTTELTRHRTLGRLFAAALAAIGVAAILPLRSLGVGRPVPPDASSWKRGDRLIDENGKLLRVEDLNVDATTVVFPESAPRDGNSQAVLLRLPAGFETRTLGYIAYSRICTHAGCPVALYRARAKQLLCPCHQSLFDVTRDGAVVSGPADHALPRLPLEIGADGYLRAAAGFAGDVGPGWWQRS